MKLPELPHIPLIEQAKNTAHFAHDSILQKRKYSGEPYWVHTDEVASIVAPFAMACKNPEAVVCAAHLHDVIEDVFPINPRFDLFFISENFGEDTAELVKDLTDVYTKEAWSDLNRDKRKKLECERIGKISPAAKTIKLADLISNTKSIVENDPDFARIYIREKLNLLGFLADGSPALLQTATMQTLEAIQKLGLTIPKFHA
jgi:(p)ppGpp synthase/HD superfamily hydrolase